VWVGGHVFDIVDGHLGAIDARPVHQA